MSAKSSQIQAMRRQQKQQQQQRMSPMDSGMGTRSVIWEGEAQLTDTNTSSNGLRLTMRLILERTASREIRYIPVLNRVLFCFNLHPQLFHVLIVVFQYTLEKCTHRIACENLS